MTKRVANARILIANSLPPLSFFQEGESYNRIGVNGHTKYVLTLNPFVNEAQRRACYAQDSPDWDCKEWSKETKETTKNAGVMSSAAPLVDTPGPKIQKTSSAIPKTKTPGQQPFQSQGGGQQPDAMQQAQRGQAIQAQGFGGPGGKDPSNPYSSAHNAKSLAEDARKKIGSSPKSAFEDADDELDEEDAPAELVGRQTSKDGRNVRAIRPKKDGLAADGDEDDHDKGSHFSPRVKADRKVEGYSVPTSVGNARKEKCPECGREMEDGHCEDCGYDEDDDEVENTQGDNMSITFNSLVRDGFSVNEYLEMIRNDFASDDQRRAFFGVVAKHGGEDSLSAHAATAKADRIGSAASHKKAANEHREAAAAHGEKDTEAGDKFAQAHKSMVKYHEGKASQAKGAGGESKGMRTKRMNKEAAASPGDVMNSYARQLLANCSCEEERTLLTRVIRNTSDEMGSGSDTDQAGDEEDSDDHDYESDEGKGLEDGMEVGGKKFKQKGKTMPRSDPLAINEYIAQAPVPLQGILKSAIQNENNRRHHMIRELVSNIDDTNRKNSMVGWLRNQSTDKLSDLIAIKGAPSRVEPVANYLGASSPTLNSYEDSSEDTLELPRMQYATNGVDE